MSEINFSDLNLIESIQRAVDRANYKKPSPIQAQAIPYLLEGSDLLGCAQTGTGKTAAFTLPMLQRLYQSKKQVSKKGVRALVLTPTRELAVQISQSVNRYGANLNQRYAVVYGGVSAASQIRSLAAGVDVLIATPGRLLDLLNQKQLRLDAVEVLVLDEADRMLDMGFIRDVRKIIKLVPTQRQTLLFSATMPKEVAELADSMLCDPKKVQITPVTSTADLIDDQILFVETENKRSLLLEVLRKDEVERVIIFTRTKHRANRLSKQLSSKGIKAEAIHGNKTQNARQRALKEFSSGKVKVLVATDIVSRGIDVDGVTHVINYELPNEPESYVHRIGRTARAGCSGVAFSFCDQGESEYLAGIEKLLGRSVVVCEDHSHHASDIFEGYQELRNKKPRAHKQRSNRSNTQRRSRSSSSRRSRPARR